ncbi:MAG TPA: response regulator [Thermodesulfovibrionales bacterium]|nr:response regulator [Thermodesulfovibrionales bacterium]
MNKPRILVIDDEDIVRISCKKCLTPEGYDVDTAANGIEGLRMAEATKYDLVLTDLKMPEMDGMEFIMKAKERQPDMRVIMITGYSTVEHAVKAMRLGAYNYIEKPFTPGTLIAAVREALETKQGKGIS